MLATDYFGRAWERVAAICRIATLSLAPNETGNVQKMQLQYNDKETRDNISVAQFYGFASSPLPGAKAVVINPSGDSGGGVVLNTHDPRYRPTGMAAGEVMVHDNAGQRVYLAGGGTIHVSAGSTIELVVGSGGTVNITIPGGTLNVNAPTINYTTTQMTVDGNLNVNGVLARNSVPVIAP